jgi:hypothetical protein
MEREDAENYIKVRRGGVWCVFFGGVQIYVDEESSSDPRVVCDSVVSLC